MVMIKVLQSKNVLLQHQYNSKMLRSQIQLQLIKGQHVEVVERLQMKLLAGETTFCWQNGLVSAENNFWDSLLGRWHCFEHYNGSRCIVQNQWPKILELTCEIRDGS